MVIGGGGLYSKWSLPLNDQLIQSLELPLVIFGVGYNCNLGDPPLSPDQLQSVARLNQKASCCTVRDEPSQRFLAGLGFNVSITGDPALQLPSRPVRLKLNDHRVKIGLNIAAHGWGLQDAYFEPVLQSYIKALSRLQQQYELQLFYLVHTTREATVAKRLKQQFPSLRICRFSAPRLLSIYEQLDLVISMMLHSSIFAFAARTPVVNIAYDEKNRAFMSLIEHEDRVIDVREVDAEHIYQRTIPILDATTPRNDDPLRETLRARTQTAVHQVRDLLGRRPTISGTA